MRRDTRAYRRTVIESFGRVRKRRMDRLRSLYLFMERPIVQGTSVAIILVCGIAFGLMIARWAA